MLEYWLLLQFCGLRIKLDSTGPRDWGTWGSLWALWPYCLLPNAEVPETHQTQMSGRWHLPRPLRVNVQYFPIASHWYSITSIFLAQVCTPLCEELRIWKLTSARLDALTVYPDGHIAHCTQKVSESGLSIDSSLLLTFLPIVTLQMRGRGGIIDMRKKGTLIEMKGPRQCQCWMTRWASVIWDSEGTEICNRKKCVWSMSSICLDLAH